MSLTASYNANTGRLSILKGQLHNGRPQRWTVKAKYKTPAGPRSTTVAPSKPCTLIELAPLLEQHIRADGDEAGGVWDIEWIATSR